MSRTDEMNRIAASVQEMARPYTDGIEIAYRHETAESLLDYPRWKVDCLNIIAGDEYFTLSREGCLLYVVNVTADSVLTAAAELLRIMSYKF